MRLATALGALVLLSACGGCREGGGPAGNTPPTVAIFSHDDGDPVFDGVRFWVSGTVDDAQSAPDALRARWIVGDAEACPFAAPDESGVTSCEVSLPVGTVRVTLEAKDPEGAEASVSVFLSGVAGEAPTAQILQPVDGTQYLTGRAVAFAGVVNDAEDDAVALRATWQSDRDGPIAVDLTPDAGGTVEASRLLTEGAHTISLVVTDTTGKTGRDTVDIVVAANGGNSPPLCTVVAPADGTSLEVGAMLTFRGSVSDLDEPATALSVTWTSDRDGLLSSAAPNAAGETSFAISSLSVGTHRVTLRVIDAQAAVCTDAVTVTVRAPPNDPPSCTITAPAWGTSVSEGATIVFTATVADANQAANTLSARWSSDRDAQLATTTPTTAGDVALSWSTLSVGTHVVTLTVTDDAAASCTDLVSVTVTGVAANTAPTVSFTGPAATQHTQGDPIAFAVTVADAEDAPTALALSWSSDLDGVFSTQGATAGGTAQATHAGLSVGAHTVTVTATDTGGLSGSDAMSITVDPPAGNRPPPAPVVSIAPSSPYENDDLVAQIDTPSVDPDGDPVTYAYAWSVDSVATTHTTSTVPAADTAGGEAWQVTVTPNDGQVDGAPGTASVTVQSGLPPVTCSLPALYERVVHTEGNVDLFEVRYAPDGSYALVLGYGGRLFRYEPGARSFTLVASVSGEYWNTIAFSEDGSYALVGGQVGFSGPVPALYQYTEAGGLVSIPDITGIGQGKLTNPARIASIAMRPGTGSFAVLSDNGGSWPSQVTYMHQITPDLAGGAHTWSYHGGLNTSQGASSVDWGESLGQPVALAVSRYLEIMRFEPLLSSGQFSLESAPNHGNLKRVIFNPVDRSVAWVLEWSGSGRVDTWEGQLRTDAQNRFAFSGWSMWDFAVSPDGVWKVFVGRNGYVWWSDSPWRPLVAAQFVQQPLPAFDQPPWNGTSNDYLASAAFRPGTCEGLIVGDATSNQGLLVRFQLQ